MKFYNKIVNPETGRAVSMNGNLGKKILRKYLKTLAKGLSGGAAAAEKKEETLEEKNIKIHKWLKIELNNKDRFIEAVTKKFGNIELLDEQNSQLSKIKTQYTILTTNASLKDWNNENAMKSRVDIVNKLIGLEEGLTKKMLKKDIEIHKSVEINIKTETGNEKGMIKEITSKKTNFMNNVNKKINKLIDEDNDECDKNCEALGMGIEKCMKNCAIDIIKKLRDKYNALNEEDEDTWVSIDTMSLRDEIIKEINKFKETVKSVRLKRDKEIHELLGISSTEYNQINFNYKNIKRNHIGKFMIALNKKIIKINWRRWNYDDEENGFNNMKNIMADFKSKFNTLGSVPENRWKSPGPMSLRHEIVSMLEEMELREAAAREQDAEAEAEPDAEAEANAAAREPEPEAEPEPREETIPRKKLFKKLATILQEELALNILSNRQIKKNTEGSVTNPNDNNGIEGNKNTDNIYKYVNKIFPDGSSVKNRYNKMFEEIMVKVNESLKPNEQYKINDDKYNKFRATCWKTTFSRILFDKNNLDYLVNPLFTNFQWMGISGFFTDKDILLNKYAWNSLIHKLIRNVYNPDVYLCCEDYADGVSGDDTSEFTHYKKKHGQNNTIPRSKSYNGKVIKCNLEYSLDRQEGEICDFNGITISNMHSPSGKKGQTIIDFVLKKYQNLLTSAIDDKLIYGGDTNIYYNLKTLKKGEKDKGKFGKTNLANLRKAIKKMDETNQPTVLISKNIINKKRPFNYFTNAQTSTKAQFPGENGVIEDTMMIFVSPALKDKIRPNEFVMNLTAMSDDDFNNLQFNIVDAFVGVTNQEFITKLNNGELTFENGKEDIKNNPLTDHHNIYVDLNLNNGNEGKPLRVLFSNNLSLVSEKGIKNNKHKFLDNVNVKKLEELTDSVVDIIVNAATNIKKLITDDKDNINNILLKNDIVKEEGKMKLADLATMSLNESAQQEFTGKISAHKIVEQNKFLNQIIDATTINDLENIKKNYDDEFKENGGWKYGQTFFKKRYEERKNELAKNT